MGIASNKGLVTNDTLLYHACFVGVPGVDRDSIRKTHERSNNISGISGECCIVALYQFHHLPTQRSYVHAFRLKTVFFLCRSNNLSVRQKMYINATSSSTAYVSNAFLVRRRNWEELADRALLFLITAVKLFSFSVVTGKNST